MRVYFLHAISGCGIIRIDIENLLVTSECQIITPSGIVSLGLIEEFRYFFAVGSRLRRNRAIVVTRLLEISQQLHSGLKCRI